MKGLPSVLPGRIPVRAERAIEIAFDCPEQTLEELVLHDCALYRRTVLCHEPHLRQGIRNQSVQQLFELVPNGARVSQPP
jgi:hypothetical protein